MASPAADDYLKTVYAHTEWQDAPITPSVLAAKLGIAPSSVTEMVKKLAAAGLVSHVPYGAVRLTEAGTARALAMVRRHRLVETWLVQEFDYGWDEVHDEAEVLEHTISDRLLEGIDARLGRPRFDPHGDAIPDVDGHVERVPFVLLADAAVGHTGRVLRVSDQDPEVLRAVEAAGIAVGVEVTVTAAGVSVDGTDAEVAHAADVIWLTA
ncbi:metal-dependent transcriptional regulator [Microbacterium sp. KSW4-16]|uniref:Manganese transport regulator n=1 Tax=Microbacterium aurugineum TaxID=2851642 RepID=A0ABY4IXK6_9MICO|nr:MULTISPECIES: metal-dependent transcriptional regulator [Microbacterium]MCK8468985.1 metal-dependent transcriptional regulator [Microbacterium aurugineum]QEA27610.1 metal-dependent transcriptional regulator [Microbacterium sp. CBA3102]TCJ21426.1 metal-dependent transcriptional regulator [Microbacterium sp. PI-1]UPL16496.1 metal-dependent transcriptional regulator [Microbacterium aurugineum]